MAHDRDGRSVRALADPTRRRLLDSLTERTGQSLRELCAGLEMARQTVSKHLAVLETANLVTTERRGREKLHSSTASRSRAIAERWIEQYDRARATVTPVDELARRRWISRRPAVEECSARHS